MQDPEIGLYPTPDFLSYTDFLIKDIRIHLYRGTNKGTLFANRETLT